MAEEDTMVQDMMGMMMVIMMVAVLSQMIPGAALAAPAEPVTGNVSIALKNPPSEGTMWSITLTDWDVTTLIDFIGKNGIERLDIAEIATFDVPAGLSLPLRIVDLSVKRWKDGIVGGTIQYLYAVQSYRPYLWDWDKNDWGTEPDPDYREAFLSVLGHSYYDVSLEAFTTG